mmetsp:Transcript_2749/g.4745  ORF Transcript_2749/g.4745 Transcript_2749/m.4745 type:complete len:516 (+) Transcript_2749:103-1650(+)|eukprot:CAMPEP_0119101688 /NCGR_PEP_ID=MMETSP1180-20130426/677_1 /TAXON_ID=3052 ORGANISM="Chlamydomonas cf sp, Strain CCMP681" /NCGR_SAMPLE_ID=MMETSP1180 /ASSEMBLY_ACC=CAM_ASM_000741 /LENGTH=515 /DNA_ID=CAMNT_0007085849 /DNA_START=74 /DNA_END=1621 /DNA_ORIENTATION=+
MPAAFPVPAVLQNDDGWGPSNSVPLHLADVPFAPFSKGDKLGRASDWTQSAYNRGPGRYGQQGQQGPAVFNFAHDEEEENFHVVDNRPVKPKPFGQRRFQRGGFQGRGRGDLQNQGRGGRDGGRGGRDGGRGRPPWQQWGRDQQRTYSSSVEIKPEWAVLEQIPFLSLAKLSCTVGEPVDLVQCGELEFYDKAFDRVSVKSETVLEKTKRAFRNVTTSEDPIIRKLSTEGAAQVFATDSILTTLMCVKSAKYSWDLVITKADGKVFFDRRAASNLHLLTVSETATEEVADDKDNINGMQQLALEATAINQNFSQQVMQKRGEKHKFPEPNPFALPGEELASCAYRYRKWRLNEETSMDIVVRCELDAMINNKGEDQFMVVKALNEHDVRTQDWRKKIDTQRSALLAFETKNNKNKVAKWTAGALLSGADMMKLGFVSRCGLRDNTSHMVLATQVVKPKDFANQISLSMEHGWGIVRAIVDLVIKLEDGKYLLVKDPMKELLRLYAIPEGVEGEQQ